MIGDMKDAVSRSAPRFVAMLFGILTGISHLDHGTLETLQGNTPTNGPIISAVPIGATWSIWKQGGEGAVTLLPTMMSAGIVTILIGVTVILWSVAFLHRKRGPAIYLLLCILSLLSGGGIGQVVFFPVIFGFSTRVGKPLAFWKRALPQATLPLLSRFWRASAIGAAVFFLAALELAILGYFPFVNDSQTVLWINWSFLLVALVLMVFAFIAAFADDLRKRTESPAAG